jgi:hypothetical protein
MCYKQATIFLDSHYILWENLTAKIHLIFLQLNLTVKRHNNLILSVNINM